MQILNVYVKAALIVCLLAGAAWLNNRYVVRPAVERNDAQWQKKWSDRNENDEKARLAALSAAREKEQRWQQQIDALQQQAASDAAKAARNLAGANAESERLRTAVAAAIGKLSSQSPGSAAVSPAGRSTGNLLAELFGKLDERASALAAEADRARAAGLRCEAAHDAIAGK